jgi:hypothetical protein
VEMMVVGGERKDPEPGGTEEVSTSLIFPENRG